MNNKIRYLQIIFVLSFFIGFVIWIQMPFDESESFFTHKKEFSGIVKEITDGMMGSKIVTFNNGAIFNIDSHYKSDIIRDDQIKLQKWEQYSINGLLQAGDSVFKTKNSDTIFVYRNNIEYIFINRYSNFDKSK